MKPAIVADSEGDQVHCMIKGVVTRGVVLKRVGQRVRIELEDGGSCWIEDKDLLTADQLSHRRRA